MPSIEDNAKIKLRVGSRIRAVGSAYLRCILVWLSTFSFGLAEWPSLRSNQQTSFPLCLENSNKWLYRY